MTRQWTRALLMTALSTLAACGGSSSEAGRTSYADGSYATSGGAAYPTAEAPESYDSEALVDDYGGEAAGGSPMPAAPPVYAQATPPAMPAGPRDPGGDADRAVPAQPTATDASPGGGPLLIYTAHLYLGVFKVEENIKSVADAARAAGGFLSQQTDTSIVIRVPAGKFFALIESIEAMGDVLHRQVQATDVSEEFRDVEIRLRNAMQVRDRLAELLSRAQKVEESLQIERELERLTGEIERLKGRMRYLQDRIAYSTITVSFQPKQQEQLNQNTFRLPFDWLDSLSLQWLLSL